MADTQITNLILDALVAHLTQKMQTEIDPTDLTYADVVKKGLLQSNKVSKNIQLGVAGGDHEDPSYTDGIVDLEKMPNISMYVPAREVGGGEQWWRRGVIQVECFLIRERLQEDEAHAAAYAVLGRTLQSVPTVNLNGLIDSFGERAVRMFCFGNTFFESGGPPKSFIFRGKVLWQCLTERP